MRTAASRTLCLFGCHREGCGGECITKSTPDRRLGPDGITTAIDLARAWAARLAACHGLLARAAAHVAGRRYGVDADDLFIEHDARRARVWVKGSLLRPTARPAREIDIETLPPKHNEETAA